jgi:hypothetical protein
MIAARPTAAGLAPTPMLRRETGAPVNAIIAFERRIVKSFLCILAIKNIC